MFFGFHASRVCTTDRRLRRRRPAADARHGLAAPLRMLARGLLLTAGAAQALPERPVRAIDSRTRTAHLLSDGLPDFPAVSTVAQAAVQGHASCPSRSEASRTPIESALAPSSNGPTCAPTAGRTALAREPC